MAITLKPEAVKEIKHIYEKEGFEPDKIFLRVGVKGGGCSGFSYLLDLTEHYNPDKDELFEQDDIKIICDLKSYLYLNGTEIGFQDGIMGRGFVFNNPSAVSTCGCGSSFSA